MALALSVVFLLSTFGVSLDLHLCQGKIKTFSFLGDAQKCAEMDENTQCESPDFAEAIQKKKCCSDANIYAQASFQTDILTHFEVKNFDFVVVPYPIQAVSLCKAEVSDTWMYPPPNDCGKQSILILHQTFLI